MGGDYSGGDLNDVSEELGEIYADDVIVNVVGNTILLRQFSKGGRVVSWESRLQGLRRSLLR